MYLKANADNRFSLICIAKLPLCYILMSMICAAAISLHVQASEDNTDLRIDSKYLQTNTESNGAITASYGISLFTDEENRRSEQIRQTAEDARNGLQDTLFPRAADDTNLTINSQLVMSANKIQFSELASHKGNKTADTVQISPLFITAILLVCAACGFLLAGISQRKRNKNSH